MNAPMIAPILIASLIALLGGCLKTPPHAPVEGAARVEVERAEFTDPQGRSCMWEAEQLWFSQQPLWVEEPPEELNGCRPPSDRVRLVEVVGQDGPYLSVVLRESDCCGADGAGGAAGGAAGDTGRLLCRTYDVRTGEVATLREYDRARADRRLARLDRLWRRQGSPAGFVLEEDAFLVDGGRVRFCAIREDEVQFIPV